MFIYKINSVDKLLSIAKSRDYVLSNPDLCFLLENPLLKDDTELAIKYNEYKQNYPNAGKEFVDYFYTHGSELDVGTLDTWRDKIIKDPELLNYANENDVNIQQIKNEKQKNVDYSWADYQLDLASKNKTLSSKTASTLIRDILDCIASPCSYSMPIGPQIGNIADTKAKYNAKNTNGSDGGFTLPGIPTYMLNKMPEALTTGVIQLCDMISKESVGIYDMVTKNDKAVQSDPYELANAEVIGGEILADLATEMGDCWRLVEYKKRYNPYNYDMNQEKADPHGTVVYDKKNNATAVTPNGNPIKTVQKEKIYSNNERLKPETKPSTPITNTATKNSTKAETKTKVESIVATNIGSIDNQFMMDLHLTIYNPAINANGVLYPDGTTDKDSARGDTCTGARIIPNGTPDSIRSQVENGTIGKLTNGAATRWIDVMRYFQALVKNKFPNKEIPKNFLGLIKKPYAKSTTGGTLNPLVGGDLNVLLKFPNGTVSLPIIDTGRSQYAVPTDSDPLWADATAQFFMEAANQNLVKLIDNKGDVVNSGLGVAFPPSEDMLRNLTRTDDKRYLKSNSIVNNTNKKNIIKARFYFSDNFCTKHGLDKEIFGLS